MSKIPAKFRVNLVLSIKKQKLYPWHQPFPKRLYFHRNRFCQQDFFAVRPKVVRRIRPGSAVGTRERIKTAVVRKPAELEKQDEWPRVMQRICALRCASFVRILKQPSGLWL